MREKKNIAIYIEHGIDEIDLYILEPPLALPCSQDIDEIAREQQEQ